MSASRFPPQMRPHRASGQERVRWKGKDIYLGPIGSPESRRRYAELLIELAGAEAAQSASTAAAAGPTIAVAVARWLAEKAPTYDPAGQFVPVMRHAFGPLLAVHAGLPCSAFDADALEAVRAEMVRRQWCATLVNDRVARLRSLWRWAERRKLAPPGSWAALRVLEPLTPNHHGVRHSVRRKAATREELDAILPRCLHVVRAMLLFQWWTGARTGEVCRLKVGEVDQTGEVWLARPARHKTQHLGKDRVIACGPEARAVLTPWLLDKPPDAWVFPSSPGVTRRAKHPPMTGPRCYRPKKYARAVKRAVREAGVRDDFSPYCLRHAAKRRIARELGLEAARVFMGHSSIGQTNEYASGMDVEAAIEVARRMG